MAENIHCVCNIPYQLNHWWIFWLFLCLAIVNMHILPENLNFVQLNLFIFNGKRDSLFWSLKSMTINLWIINCTCVYKKRNINKIRYCFPINVNRIVFREMLCLVRFIFYLPFFLFFHFFISGWWGCSLGMDIWPEPNTPNPKNGRKEPATSRLKILLWALPTVIKCL